MYAHMCVYIHIGSMQEAVIVYILCFVCLSKMCLCVLLSSSIRETLLRSFRLTATSTVQCKCSGS